MDYFERHQGGERTLLVNLAIDSLPVSDWDEFRLLARSAGADVLAEIAGHRQRPDAQYFMGSGKAEEVAALVRDEQIDLVILGHELTPSQERNLERLCQCRVIDRTGLILDIFAQRARTFEGKLQVELAQLSHLSTRLVRGWTHLERQGGGIGLRGPGETQLETDRRLLRLRVTQLKERLAKVRQNRAQNRALRRKQAIPTISLVGYTNAGKSTLFNTLTHSDVLAEDLLFATLDPTLRRVVWPGLGPVVLVDTVGFVRHLPHELVESFRATLEETLEADLLLHVIDSNSPERDEQIEAVEAVLNEIGSTAPVIRVYNKIDQSGEAPGAYEDSEGIVGRVFISAHQQLGLNDLQEAVTTRLAGLQQAYTLMIPPHAGRLRHLLFDRQVVTEDETIDELGQTRLTIRIAADELRQLLAQCHLRATDVLAPEVAEQLCPTTPDWVAPSDHAETPVS